MSLSTVHLIWIVRVRFHINIFSLRNVIDIAACICFAWKERGKARGRDYIYFAIHIFTKVFNSAKCIYFSPIVCMETQTVIPTCSWAKCSRVTYKGHLYCLAMWASFYSDAVECLPDSEPGGPGFDPHGGRGFFWPGYNFKLTSVADIGEDPATTILEWMKGIYDG